ncbi:MAG: DUF4384 domain-containing protein [Spirochaetaceae bacterium]|jgi:hypothetical protein|nr:DUF4384 domain-containing protein [Spirochaetaceae bacterium]
MKIKLFTLTICFLISTYTLAAELPQWVTSFGVHTLLGGEYLSGFGMSPLGDSPSDAVDAAKTQALNDLVRQVRVQISSELVDRAQGNENYSRSFFSSVTKSSADLELPGADFKIENNGVSVFVLAYLNRNRLVEDLQGRAQEQLLRILELNKSAGERATQGLNSQAASIYAQSLPLFSEVYSDCTVLRTLSSQGQEELFRSLGQQELQSLEDLISLEQNINITIESLRGSQELNLDQAMAKILFLLKEQQVRGGRLQNPPLSFQQTDFSSPFGKYAADKLAQLLEGGLPSGGNPTVIQGSYWLRDDEVELLIQARDSVEGAVIGSASAVFPRASLDDSMDLEPQNSLQSLVDLLEFQEGAMTDGSIHLDIWTDKGRNEDVLVYSEGEELQLYFRVNQPCYLQLTYFLASGEKVLLEENFYIGIDKVNRVVALPYLFEVVPPLGVERLVVTAFSSQPPAPPISPQNIQGESYLVFGSMEDVVSQTRGLRRSSSAGQELRTGEAQLAITTLP